MFGLKETQKITETMNLTEMRDKIKETESGKTTQDMINAGYYDYEECNIFGTGYKQREEGIKRMGQEDAAKITNTLRLAPLKEFFARSGTSGIMGAVYLIPVKLHQVLYDAAWQKDITEDISMEVLGPDAIPGTTQDVAIISHEGVTAFDVFTPLKYSAGGELPDTATVIKKAQLDFTSAFGYRFELARDLIEDAQWDMFEAHLRNAAGGIGEYATNLAVGIALTATDGDGTAETNNAGNNTTLLSHVILNYTAVTVNHFMPDIFITAPEAWFDAICQDTTYTSYSDTWHNTAIVDPVRTGLKLFGMNVLWNLTSATQADEAGTPQIHQSLLCKNYSLLSGRKRWMRIENYSEPRRDLAGATVTCRQDSVSIYNQSIAIMKET